MLSCWSTDPFNAAAHSSSATSSSTAAASSTLPLPLPLIQPPVTRSSTGGGAAAAAHALSASGAARSSGGSMLDDFDVELGFAADTQLSSSAGVAAGADELFPPPFGMLVDSGSGHHAAAVSSMPARLAQVSF